MNLCRACREDFGSTSAFDQHRVGKHAFTFAEGMKMDPPHEDGRRCLAPSEMTEKGWKKDGHGRWRTPSRGEVWT